MTTDAVSNDRLGVLSSTMTVLEQASSVRIEPERFPAVAQSLRESPPTTPAWRSFPHWWSDEPAETMMYVLILDTLNFCFWGEPRWTVTTDQGTYNGYFALAAALRGAVERGEPLLDPDWLERVDTESLTRLLGGSNRLPLMPERAANLRELGRGIREGLGGDPLKLLDDSGYDAVELVENAVRLFSSFRDVATYDEREVRILKRAQILASDLVGALAGSMAKPLSGLEHLTAFADYKVPQVLRELGLLTYAPGLAGRVDHQIELPAGSREEVEIRAATVWAVEALRQEMTRQGSSIHAYEIDWLLWNIGQSLENPRPYHRTRTIYY